jgi:hypothetical protein
MRNFTSAAFQPLNELAGKTVFKRTFLVFKHHLIRSNLEQDALDVWFEIFWKLIR